MPSHSTTAHETPLTSSSWTIRSPVPPHNARISINRCKSTRSIFRSAALSVRGGAYASAGGCGRLFKKFQMPMLSFLPGVRNLQTHSIIAIYSPGISKGVMARLNFVLKSRRTDIFVDCIFSSIADLRINHCQPASDGQTANRSIAALRACRYNPCFKHRHYGY